MNFTLAARLEEIILGQFSARNARHVNRPQILQEDFLRIKDCLESGMVSNSGFYLDLAEEEISKKTQSPFALCTQSGTAALHLGLKAMGIGSSSIVITTPFTYIATSNALLQAGAIPHYLDIEPQHLMLDPKEVRKVIRKEYENIQGTFIHKVTGRQLGGILVVHLFGHPADMNGFEKIREEFNIPILEDAAQAFGSSFAGTPLGSFGEFGIFSFNGNKIMTSGQGGALITREKWLYEKALSLSMNGMVGKNGKRKIQGPGFNYRMSNLNAALLCGELERLDERIKRRKELKSQYDAVLKECDVSLQKPRPQSLVNHWIQVIRFADLREKDALLTYFKNKNLGIANAWPLIHNQKGFSQFPKGKLEHAETEAEKLVFLPSSPDLPIPSKRILPLESYS